MSITKIHKVSALTYDTVLIGMRFYSENQAYDVDLQTLTGVGILNINIKPQVPLIEVGNLLISEEEQHGLKVTDISESADRLKGLIEVLIHDNHYKNIFKQQEPHEQTLKVFMEDQRWRPERIHRNDEYNNQHYLHQPDGKKWRGGWIGKNRSSEKAKANFHYEQVIWAIHKGRTVPEEVLADYPDAKQYFDLIREIQTRMSVQTTETQIILTHLEDREVNINLLDYPDSIINQRGFVVKHNLIPSSLSGIEIKKGFLTLDPRELTIIAFRREKAKQLKHQMRQLQTKQGK